MDIPQLDTPVRSTKPRRPGFGRVMAAGLVFVVVTRLVRLEADHLFGSFLGWLLTLGATLAVIGGFRLRARQRRAGGDDEDFAPERIRAHYERSGVGPPMFEGDGTLVGAPVLVVSQRTKAIEVVNEYAVFGHDGTCLASVRQVGQGKVKRVARVLMALDIFFTHDFEVLDPSGVRIAWLRRPRKWFHSKVHVWDGDGVYRGMLRQENVFGHVRFRIVAASGMDVGLLRANNWRAWDFALRDRSGRVVGQLVKTWEGWGRTFFTTADRYVIAFASPLDDELRFLAVMTGLAVDVALKQDSRGVNGLAG